MEQQYPGLRTLAKRYWLQYIVAFVGQAMLFIASGAVAMLIVLFAYPEGLPYLLVGILSLSVHTAALYLRDVWTSEHEPGQTQFSSSAQIIAIMSVVLTLLIFLQLFAVFLSVAISILVPEATVLAMIVAAYYPVIDLFATRKSKLTPSGIITIGLISIISSVLDIHDSIIESVPIVGDKQRPQF